MAKKKIREGWLFRKGSAGCLRLLLPLFLCALAAANPAALAAPAADGAAEALELRSQAEQAIAEERRAGHIELAEVMHRSLPDLLLEYLATRDGSIALDTVDAAFVQEKLKEAKVMEEPGVALALDVFSGQGTGYEHGLRTSIANLADFNERKAGQVSDAALEAHERIIENHLERLDGRLARMDAKMDMLQSRLEGRLNALQKIQGAQDRISAVAEKVADQSNANAKAIDALQSKAGNGLNQAAQSVSAGGPPSPTGGGPPDVTPSGRRESPPRR